MKHTKKILSALFLVAMCLPLPAYAAEPDSSTLHGVIDLSDVENNPNVFISEPMSFPEMVTQYAENEGISYQEALAILPEAAENTTRSIEYRTFTVYLPVTNSYKPHIDFLCQTSEGGHFRNIDSIYSIQLVRSYGSVSKQFNGQIEAWLRTHNKIEYVVNGDFFNNGATTASGGTNISIPVGGKATVTFEASISTTSNHYTYFYKHDTVTYGG